MILFLVLFCAVTALGFGVASGWSDFKGLKIPNMYSVAVIGAFAAAFLAVMIFAPESHYFFHWKSHLIAGAVMFGVTFVLFLSGILGAGDSKLASAYALWVGLQGLPSFLFFMTVCGGVLGLTTLVLQKLKPFKNASEGGWVAQAQKGGTSVPYGIAIAFGAVAAFAQVGFFDMENLFALAANH